jgi:hypothetical protein
VRPVFIYVSLATLVSSVACDEGSAGGSCPDGQVSCNGICHPSAYYCPSTSNPGTGGTTAAATTFVPIDPGPISSPDCTDAATLSGKFTTAYGGTNIATTSGGKSYYLHTNWWGLYDSQTVSYQGLSFTINNPANAAVSATEGNPMGYPSLFIGSYSGHTTTASGLPKQVSALTTVPTLFSTNAAEASIANHNAAYDVWFTDTAAPLSASQYSPPPGGAFLMVWMFKPTSRQPRGSIKKSGATIPGVEGSWNVWVDSSSPPCISYVSVNPLNGLAFDLNKFIQDSVTNKYGITSSMYLSVIFGGFEVWGGADNLQLKNFCAKVN